MAFATWADYTDYLSGRTAKLQQVSFGYYEAEARRLIINCTLGNVTDLTTPTTALKNCTCKIAEMVMINESADGIASENVDGWSRSYDKTVSFEKNISRTVKQYLTDWNGSENLLYSGVF